MNLGHSRYESASAQYDVLVSDVYLAVHSPVSQWFNLLQQAEILGPALVDGQQQQIEII